MSKDVVIAGVIVAACLGLVTVAFVVPKQKSTGPELASNDEPLVPSTPSDPGTPSDPFAPSTPGNTFTPIPEPTNPFAPSNPYPPSGSNPQQPGVNPFPPPLQPLTPVEPPPSTPVVSEARTHVVGSGETLGEISAKHYGTAKHWKKIAEANKVDANDLKVGQKLTIPAIEPVVATAPTTPDLASGERTYTIQKNDSYYSIAKKELGNASRWKELEKLNGIPSEDLRVGKVIKLPAKAAAVDPLTTPAPETLTPGDPNVHVVKAGETLSDISKLRYGTTTKWKEIVKANPGIDPEGLKVGQKLKLPEIAGTTPAPAGTGSAPADNPAATYTVKAGEYLEDIALSQLGSRGAWKKIVDANPGIDPKRLRVGQKLVIPGKSAPAPEPVPVTPPPSGFGTQPSGFGTQPSGFGTQPSGFGTQPSGFGTQPSGFGTPSSGGSTYPAPTGTPPSSPGSAPSNDNPFGLPPK
jgi:nucleoid-associated protein YgaU